MLGVRALHHLTVDGQFHVDVGEVDIVGADDGGSKRAERIEALAVVKLAQRRLELRAPAGDIVHAGNATNRRERVVQRGAVGALPDDDGKLALEIGARLLARNHDRLAMTNQAGGELGEHNGNRRDIEFRLLRVVAVIEADCDDLARHDGVEQLHVGDRGRGTGGCGDDGPTFHGRHEALVAGATGIDDGFALKTTEADLAGCIPITHCVHGVLRDSTRSSISTPADLDTICASIGRVRHDRQAAAGQGRPYLAARL